MSIVDAIQRAKQLGRERSSGESRAGAEPSAGDTVRTQLAAATERVTAGAEVSPQRLERPHFAVLQYDASVCSERHLILPGADERMLQMAAPSYRILRTRILQRCRTHGWWNLAVTSPGPGEGKSTTAINLAVSIAREGNQDVFLLDLDMRNPSICRYLGIAPRHDISEFFAGAVPASEIFFSVGIERLTIAGSNIGTTHASELLATNYLEKLLDYIRAISANPLVLIDLPPVVNTDDALILAPRVDATVLVVSEGYTRRDNLDKAVGLFADFKMAGVVLNRTNESVGSEYYGAYA